MLLDVDVWDKISMNDESIPVAKELIFMAKFNTTSVFLGSRREVEYPASLPLNFILLKETCIDLLLVVKVGKYLFWASG